MRSWGCLLPSSQLLRRGSGERSRKGARAPPRGNRACIAWSRAAVDSAFLLSVLYYILFRYQSLGSTGHCKIPRLIDAHATQNACHPRRHGLEH